MGCLLICFQVTPIIFGDLFVICWHQSRPVCCTWYWSLNGSVIECLSTVRVTVFCCWVRQFSWGLAPIRKRHCKRRLCFKFQLPPNLKDIAVSQIKLHVYTALYLHKNPRELRIPNLNWSQISEQKWKILISHNFFLEFLP